VRSKRIENYIENRVENVIENVISNVIENVIENALKTVALLTSFKTAQFLLKLSMLVNFKVQKLEKAKNAKRRKSIFKSQKLHRELQETQMTFLIKIFKISYFFGLL
jgi:hypothetical protein